jgi:hypothetical protein
MSPLVLSQNVMYPNTPIRIDTVKEPVMARFTVTAKRRAVGLRSEPIARKVWWWQTKAKAIVPRAGKGFAWTSSYFHSADLADATSSARRYLKAIT